MVGGARGLLQASEDGSGLSAPDGVSSRCAYGTNAFCVGVHVLSRPFHITTCHGGHSAYACSQGSTFAFHHMQAYKATCQNIQYLGTEGGTIIANCRNGGGGYSSTLLKNASSCVNGIINEKGILQCAE